MKKTTVSLLTLALLAILLPILLISCTDVRPEGDWETATYLNDTTLGTGAKTVTVTVSADGQSLVFTLRTDKENLEDALTEHRLIDGEQGAFGLYIKMVNGIVADYDKDGYYWSITKAGAETSGAKSTPVSDGDAFEIAKVKSPW